MEAHPVDRSAVVTEDRSAVVMEDHSVVDTVDRSVVDTVDHSPAEARSLAEVDLSAVDLLTRPVDLSEVC